MEEKRVTTFRYSCAVPTHSGERLRQLWTRTTLADVEPDRHAQCGLVKSSRTPCRDAAAEEFVMHELVGFALLLGNIFVGALIVWRFVALFE